MFNFSEKFNFNVLIKFKPQYILIKGPSGSSELILVMFWLFQIPFAIIQMLNYLYYSPNFTFTQFDPPFRFGKEWFKHNNFNAILMHLKMKIKGTKWLTY